MGVNVSLLVMAAGLGSRFGGTKQLASVGPDGEAFLDFAIGDAVAAGVGKVVLVVRTDIIDDVKRHIASRSHEVEIAYVCQDTHGPHRDKPWGTGQAVLVAAPEIDGPFVVCNADDYYGSSTYHKVVAAATDLPSDRVLLAGFRLDRTLPEIGEVSRGICRVEGSEMLGLTETHGVGRRDDGTITGRDPEGVLPGDAVASMNFWAFPQRIFDDLEAGFSKFLTEHGDQPKTEYLLPAEVAVLRDAGEFTVGVVTTDEAWVGVTNPDDLEVARRRIAEMRAS